MTFYMQNLSKNKEVLESKLHQKFLALSKGIPVSTRMLDSVNGNVFYCVKRGGGPNVEPWPGKYILFIGENSFVLLVKEKFLSKELVRLYEVVSIEPIEDYVDVTDSVKEIIKDALTSYKSAHFLTKEPVLVRFLMGNGNDY